MSFLRGTRILTDRGPTAVEALMIGDAVVTHFRGLQPIRWIGRRSYDGNVTPLEGPPVRIRAGAIADNMPLRDLLVSPDHSLLLNGILIYADLMINGITIFPSEPAVHVQYYQIDLGQHDCILAEGAWADTFADLPDARQKFDNAHEYYELYPSAQKPG